MTIEALITPKLQTSEKRNIAFGKNYLYASLKEILNINYWTSDIASIQRDDDFISPCDITQDDRLIVFSCGSIILAINKARRYTPDVVHILDVLSNDKAYLKDHGVPTQHLELPFNHGFHEWLEISSTSPSLSKLRSRFADPLSVKQFDKILKFRSTYDITHLLGFQNREHCQYLDPVLDETATNGLLYDVGGYNGETTISFIKAYDNQISSICFEPDRDNFKACCTNLSHYSNVTVEQTILSDRSGFANLVGSDSTVKVAAKSDTSADPQITVKMQTLDDYAAESARWPSIIKIDTEGHELSVLEGAKNTIKEYHPALLVSCYHKPSDLLDIPDYVLALYPEYSLYFRHYTQSMYESVYIFVP